jgi:small-conductance mechanosensitive channel
LDLINTFAAHPAVGNILSSVAVVVAAIVVYRLVASRIRKVEWHSAEIGRRWLVMVRNVMILVVVFALFVIWASQLRTLAFSLVGFAVAIVLITKELAMCLTGGMLRSSSGMFDIGHRIEIHGLRGDVIDMKMLTTTVLEIGPERLTHMHTGRAVVLPNSLFLSEPLVNESFTRDYVLQATVVPLNREADWGRAEKHLLQAAEEVCEEFIDGARHHIQRVARRAGIEMPPIDPRVTLHLPEPEKVNLILRFPTPARRKGRTEQEILRRYLALEQAAGQS